MIGLALLPNTIIATGDEAKTTRISKQPATEGVSDSAPARPGPPPKKTIPERVQKQIFGRSLLLGGVLGGLGGYVGFQLGNQRAKTVCLAPEGCASDWILPLTGTMLGAGAGLVFAPGYVAGDAGYRCDMDGRILAYAGGAIGGGLLMGLGLFGQDPQAFAQGLALPWLLPIWACIGSLEPTQTPEGAP